MATVFKEVYAKQGQWTNLNWSIGVDYSIDIRSPRGATVRVFHGTPWFGWTAEEVTLDGEEYKRLSVSAGLPTFVQIKTNHDTRVHFYYTPGSGGPPKIKVKF